MSVIAGIPMLKYMPNKLLTAQPSTKEFNFKPKKLTFLDATIQHSLRSLIRDKTLTVSSILAMGGAIAVAISYSLAMTSTFGTVETSFKQEKWSHAVDFQYPLFVDEAEAIFKLENIWQKESYYRTAGAIRNRDKQSIASIVGLNIPSTMREITPVQGRQIQSQSEIIISIDLARELGITEPGIDLIIEKGSISEKLTVVGITNDIFLKTVIVALPVAQQLAQSELKVTGYYLMADPIVQKVISLNSDEVARVVDKQNLIDHFRREINDMMGIVYITIFFSVGVSLLFVTTLIYLSIVEKRGEYVLLRSMGFAEKRLKYMILVMVGVQILFALMLSIPGSFGLVLLLNEQMGKAWFAVELFYKIGDFALPMFAALFIAPAVCIFGVRHVVSLNLPEILRTRGI